MPNRDKSTQAAKNSNGGAYPNVNYIGGNPDVHYKSINPNACRHARFSEKPKTYYVSISATHNGKRIDFSDIYDEYHPLMAIGRAVLDVKQDKYGVSIEAICIYERTIKNR